METYLKCPSCGSVSWQPYKIVDTPYLDKKEVYVQCAVCGLICEEDTVKLIQNSGDNEKDKPLTPSSPFIKVHRINRNNNPRPVYINYNYITRIVPIDDSDDYHSSISMMNYPEWQDFRLKETAEEIVEKIKEAEG